MNKKLLVVHLFFLCCLQQAVAQEASLKSLKITPYIGLSVPQGELRNFAKNGATFGISTDMYLGGNFALGLDYNYQSNNFSNPFDFSGIATPYSTLMDTKGKWSASILTFGPTYKYGTPKFTAEFFAKFGLLYLKTPQAAAELQYPTATKTIFDLPIQERSGFGITSGIRLNYQISKNLSFFLNPQFVYGTTKVEYCNCGLDNLDDPELIITQQPVKETFSPSYFNINAGLAFSFGGIKKDPIKNSDDPQETQKSRETICDSSILKSPYNGQTYFAESGIVPEFQWVNHSRPKAKYYVFELYYGDKLILEETVNKATFKFTKKMTSDFYNLKGKRDYSWRIITHYANCETTTTDFNYFSIIPKNTASRSSCALELVVNDIYCSDPAYSESGMIKYIGTFTVYNNTPSLPGILIPNPNALGPIQLFGTNSPGATLTYSQGGFSSPCAATPMQSTIHGPALPANSSATFCFELEVPSGTNTIKFYANMNTYTPGEELPATCPTNVTIELPVCACDACDTWDFTNETHSHIADAANNNPYVSHGIMQSFKLPSSDPIKNIKAEIIYVNHAANDPQCYTCTTQVKDMGMFSAINAKPKDILANPLDWINNNEGILDRDQNNDGYSNRINWQARNPVTGVDFASRFHNFQMWINLPGDNSLECCNHQYEVWIRYTFEDINCISCSTVIKYNLSEGQGSPSGTTGTGSGTILGSGMSNPQNGTISPKQLTPKN